MTKQIFGTDLTILYWGNAPGAMRHDPSDPVVVDHTCHCTRPLLVRVDSAGCDCAGRIAGADRTGADSPRPGVLWFWQRHGHASTGPADHDRSADADRGGGSGQPQFAGIHEQTTGYPPAGNHAGRGAAQLGHQQHGCSSIFSACYSGHQPEIQNECLTPADAHGICGDPGQLGNTGEHLDQRGGKWIDDPVRPAADRHAGADAGRHPCAGSGPALYVVLRPASDPRAPSTANPDRLLRPASLSRRAAYCR